MTSTSRALLWAMSLSILPKGTGSDFSTRTRSVVSRVNAT